MFCQPLVVNKISIGDRRRARACDPRLAINKMSVLAAAAPSPFVPLRQSARAPLENDYVTPLSVGLSKDVKCQAEAAV